MAFKMTGAPYLKSAFKDSGHGGEAFHDHQVVPTEGAPTAKPGGLMSQNAINLAYAANEKAASSSSNSKTKSKSSSKGKGGYQGGAPGSRGRKKKNDSVTYKCTGKGCGAQGKPS